MPSVVWQWDEESATSGKPVRSRDALGFATAWEWEEKQQIRWGRFLAAAWGRLRRPLAQVVLFGVALAAALQFAAGPDSAVGALELRRALTEAQLARQQAEGEMELLRIETARLHTVMEFSAKHGIPADLAADIYDIALAEGVDPKLAFALVKVESEFYPRAVSSAGAVGLTQLMPSTAFQLQPGLRYHDLFERKTNLHLGFRYLRLMLEQYKGDLRLALLAYNRGPGRVDEIRQQGGDPGNGYARAVMRGY